MDNDHRTHDRGKHALVKRRHYLLYAAELAILILAFLLILPGCATPPSKGVTRTYYIAADPVEWNYAPTDTDLALGMGKPIPESAYALIGHKGHGQVFRKAVYRAYTDSTFTELKPRPAKWRHLGILGPVLRGAVGDTIVVWFKNNTGFPASVHPHGVFYDKKSEGALYYDGTSGANRMDDSVAPGKKYRYVWPIPERAGPGPNDPSSILWAYHSHTHEFADFNAGLVGPIIVTRRGMARPDGSPKDVDREFVTIFMSVFEGPGTHYFNLNMKRYSGDTTGVDSKGQPIYFHFIFQDFFETMNGLQFGNLPVSSLTMKEGEHVRWYVFAGTSFDDNHSPHWHGNTVLIRGVRKDLISLEPLTMVTADMDPDDPGTWLYHCHVAEHILGGMAARYCVLPPDGIVPADTAQGRINDPMTGIVKDLAMNN